MATVDVPIAGRSHRLHVHALEEPRDGRSSISGSRITDQKPGIAAPLAGLCIALLGFVPIANWIPRGWAQSTVAANVNAWLIGSLIAIGGGVVVAILSRPSPALWREGATAPLARLYDRRPVTFAAGLALLSLLLNVAVSTFAFSRRPLSVDEVSQLVQAQIYASGRLWRPTPPNLEFFSLPVFVDVSPKMYSGFPPGGPAMLAVGEKFGAGWLSTPLWGAVAVLAWIAWLRAAEPRSGTAAWAAVLFAFSPFGFFMAGSHMNHTATLMWILVGAAGLAHAMRSPTPRPLLAFVSGLGFGAAATIRPADALAFALPAGIWYLWRALRDPRRWADALAAGLGVALPMALMMWVNVQTTGAPLRSGLQIIFGREHAPGFHMAPNGILHTPARGLELISIYFWALQKSLFQTMVPSLLFVVAALLLARRLSAYDRYLLAVSTLIVVLYWMLWVDASYLGPRYFHTLLPFCVLWAARLPALLRERGWTGVPYRTTVYAAGIAAGLAVALNIPIQWASYSTGSVAERFNADAAAEREGVRDALVLVREEWAVQLVTRMRALGLRPAHLFLIYDVDTCILEGVVDALERNGVRGKRAEMRLLALRDSSRAAKSTAAPSAIEPISTDAPFLDRCRRRLLDNMRGTALFLPTNAARGPNVYARDLHGRDSLLMRQYPDRAVYLLAPVSADVGAAWRFYPVNLDSAWVAWRSD